MGSLSDKVKRDIALFAAFSSTIFWDDMNYERRGELKEIYPEIMKSPVSREYLPHVLSKVWQNGNFEYSMFKFRSNLSRLERECLKS